MSRDEIAMQITIAAIQSGPAYKLDSPDKVAVFYETVFQQIFESHNKKRDLSND